MIGLEHYKSKDWYSPGALCSFSRCPRHYFFSKGCRLMKLPVHCSLDFGRAMHKGFPVATTQGPAAAIKAFKEEWGSNEGDAKRNIEAASAILSDFALRQKPYELWKAPPAKLKADVNEWEIPFALDLDLEKPIMGILDGWGKNKATLRPCGVEYKTSSYGIGGGFFDSFRRNPQIIIYDMVLKEFIEDFEGVMLEGVFVGKNENNVCQPIWITDQETERCKDWIRRKATEIQICEEHGVWPQEFSACNSYPWFYKPGFNCDFLDLCQSPRWTELLDLYEVSEHSPFWLD